MSTTIAMLLASVLLIAYPRQTALNELRPPDDCAQYLGRACDNWMLATWLPELETQDRAVSVIPFTDGFIVEGRWPQGPSFAGTQGAPTTGTAFTYGKAGPPRGFVLYDAVHRIALYGQGCCSWHSAVLAAGVSPPPLPVSAASLSNIRTTHGIHLGMTTAEAMRIYGRAHLAPATGVPGVSLVSYRHAMPDKWGNSCGQDVTLGFFRNRLIYLEFDNAC